MTNDDYAMRKTQETLEKSLKLAEAAAREYQKISAQQRNRNIELAITGLLEALNKEVNELDRYLSGKNRKEPSRGLQSHDKQPKGSLGLSFDEAISKAKADAYTHNLENAGKNLSKGLGKQTIDFER